AKGVSCHTLPALQNATASDWTEVHLVRINPQGKYMDAPGSQEHWSRENTADTEPVLKELQTMHAKGRGEIGMKMFGNGDFFSPEGGDKALRFAMSHKEISAVVIGFTHRDQIDDTLKRMNRALAEV